jgi:Tfp pilus assembly protein PilN
VSTQTLTASRIATYPHVNLLPPEIEEERRFRKVQVGLASAVVGALGVVGMLYMIASNQAADAGTELQAAQAGNISLQQQAAQFAQVPAVYAQVEAATAQVTQAMAQEVRWSFYLNDLSLSVPPRVWVTGMTVTQNVDTTTLPGTPAPGATAGGVDAVNPLATPGIGQIAFEGKALEHDDVAAWLDSLAQQKGYADPYFSVSEVTDIDEREVVTYQSQVTLTDEALSGRHTPKAGD